MVQIVYLPADVGVVARTLRVGEYVSRLLLKTCHRLCFSVEQSVFPLQAIIDAPGAGAEPENLSSSLPAQPSAPESLKRSTMQNLFARSLRRTCRLAGGFFPETSRAGQRVGLFPLYRHAPALSWLSLTRSFHPLASLLQKNGRHDPAGAVVPRPFHCRMSSVLHGIMCRFRHTSGRSSKRTLPQRHSRDPGFVLL